MERTTVKKIKVLAIAALAAATTMLPISASANTAAPTPPKANAELEVFAEILAPQAPGLPYHTPGSCSRGWVRINAHTIAARESKSTTAPVSFLIRSPDGFSPMYYSCRSLEVGAGYGPVCNGPGNTGWILVTAPKCDGRGGS
jgi:hypothetical protein